MVTLPNEIIGDAYTDKTAWKTLTDLVDVGNRMAGQEGERTGAEIIHDKFEANGLHAVSMNEFDIPGWWREDSSLRIKTQNEIEFNKPHEEIALPGSPSGTVTAPIVDVGTGTPDEFENTDVEGKIAIVSSRTPSDYDRWLHRMEKYVSAYEHGAEGFVFRNHIEGCLPPTGEIGYHNRPGPIPAIGVSKEVGVQLQRYCNNTDPEATLSVTSQSKQTTSQNVEGVVGPDTDDEVLVTAHVDAHDISQGANDNGVGSVLVAEIGRLLSQCESKLETKVRCVTFGAEEIGLFGAYHLADTHNLNDIKCVINIDGAGTSRNLHIGANEFTDLKHTFEEVTESFEVPLQTSNTISPHGDQWAFVQDGVPAVMASTTSEKSGRGWGHTHADTLDKIDRRDLRDIAVILTESVLTISEKEREFTHKSREEIQELIDEGYKQELKKGGRWPYS
ncbi:MAG: M28 family peptidase [Halobacteriaceae archaeon]